MLDSREPSACERGMTVKFSKIFTRAIALLLMMTLLTGLVPESCITLTSKWISALAEEQAASEAAQPVSDVLTSDSGWLYRICADGHAMLLGHADTSAAQLTLPTVVDGAWVVRIGENAFADNAALTEVFIPGSITEIASSAFSAQPSLNIRAWNGAGALAFAQKRGFGSSNLSEHVRIIHYWRKEIHSVDYRDIVGKLINAGIIAALKANQNTRVTYLRQTRQNV